MDVRANPFQDRGHWFWRDDKQVARGPYHDQMGALRDLLRHCDKRTRWERFKYLVWDLVAA